MDSGGRIYRAVACGLVLGLASTVPMLAQDDLAFEVVSVHPSRPAPARNGVRGPTTTVSGGPGTSDPEHLRYVRVSMLRLLAMAFLAQADQFVGPDWAKDDDAPERFDISANIPPGATREQVSVMLRNLLKERFHLAYHCEKKDFEVYALEVAKNGPNFGEAEAPAEPPPALQAGPGRANRGHDGFPILPAGQTAAGGVSKTGGIHFNMRVFDGFQLALGSGARPVGLGGLTQFTLRMVTMPQLIGVVQPYMETSHVVDRTGLTGKYDIKVAFSTGNDPSDPAPDVFSAFEKQLGLKFRKTKALLDVVIIDHIEKVPTEN